MKNLVMMLLAPIALAATACSTGTVDSSQVNASAIHEDYSVTYSADANQMSLYAQFRVGDWSGTTVHLSEPAQLTVNNQKISATDFLGTYYSKTFANGFVPTSQVVYTGSTGIAHSYNATLTAISFTAPSAPVTAATNLNVQLQGTAQDGTESIAATISQTVAGPNNTQNYITLNGHYDPSMNRMVFYNTDLQTLQAGNASLNVTRSRSSGPLSTTYDAGTRTIQITK